MPDRIDLDELERDVEEARARLAGDFARLHDPKTLAAAKDELLMQADAYKDEALARARRSVAATTQALVEQARLRVERNPTAALALGAGLAWKLARNPPIGGLLVAAGIAGLLVTRPSESGSRTPTTDALLAARDAALAKARHATTAVQETRRQMGRQIRGRAVDLSEKASALAAEAATRVADAAGEAGGQASEASARAADYAERTRRFAREQFKQNPFYFGAAALALGAALGLATTRDRGAS